MRVHFDRLEPLAAPAFIGSLALLVLNDVALKPLFHNSLTGKLSDVAGLFALTVFAATLWPRQRRFAAGSIAGAFAFWKTTSAEPLIEWLNTVSPFALGRTVDLTDLMALPMIPLALWAAPRLRPWPLPRALQVSLAVLAPLAFTATSRLPYGVRSTMDVSSTVGIDEGAVQRFFDDVAEQHGLRCQICDPIAEGRVYLRASGSSGPGALVVNFNGERRTLFFATSSSYSRAEERDALAFAADIRAGMTELFPGVAATEFTAGPEGVVRPGEVTMFVVRVPSSGAMPVESAESAKRTMSSIVEAVVRAHDLRTDASSLVYYAGRRVGVGPEERDLVVVPVSDDNSTLRVRVIRYTAGFETLQRAVTEDLAARLDAAFGPANVERRAIPM